MRLFEFKSTSSKDLVTTADLDELEAYLNTLYAANNIDFKFTRHFLKRVNDARNKRQITTGELMNMFGKAQKRYGSRIANMDDKWQAVISDTRASINCPFVLNVDKERGEMQLVVKSVMRSDNFKTFDKKLPV